MAYLLRRFPWLRAFIISLLFPSLAGADDGDGDGGEEGDGDKPAEGDADGDKGGDESSKSAEDYRKELRESDRVRKREADKAQKRIEKLEADAKKRDDADKSEQEKAIEAARAEGEQKAGEVHEKARRADRLEVAVTRAATSGIKVPDGDKEKAVRFKDSDDAHAFIERQLAKGELDEDEIFDSEGKVKPDGLADALRSLLEAKPHWAEGSVPEQTGDPGTRKGDPADSDMEKLSVEDHIARKDPAKK